MPGLAVPKLHNVTAVLDAARRCVKRCVFNSVDSLRVVSSRDAGGEPLLTAGPEKATALREQEVRRDRDAMSVVLQQLHVAVQ